MVLGLWGPNLLRPPPPAWTTYISIKNQIRRVKLADHSLVRLNGASAVKVMFEDRLRRAAFDGGEAEFDVAANGRLFRLSVGDREIGTGDAVFNLRRYGRMEATNTTLTLRRGLVQVGQVGGQDPARTLAPGDQLTWADGHAAPPQLKVDPNIAFAWQSHRLIYRQTPLKTVVADLNRYVDRPIRIAQIPVGELPFSGILVIDSEDRMLKRIEASLPVRAQTLSAGIVLSPSPPKTPPGERVSS
jgi:transmembrane sensor